MNKKLSLLFLFVALCLGLASAPTASAYRCYNCHRGYVRVNHHPYYNHRYYRACRNVWIGGNLVRRCV